MRSLMPVRATGSRRATHCCSSISPSEHLQELLLGPPPMRTSSTRSCSRSSSGRSSRRGGSSDASSSRSSRSSSSSRSGHASTHPADAAASLMTRRQLGIALPAANAALVAMASLVAAPPAAEASKLGAGVDSAWEAMGGGPADLTFPETWLGVWDVTSTLVGVELPLGEGVVSPSSLSAVRRAQQEDLNKPLLYQVAFMRNPSGKVVYDRRFNTASLLATYYGNNMDFAGRITWNPQDPNSLNLQLPGTEVKTRIMRRSEQAVADDRFETSEFMQQVFETGDPARPRVKASQCFTKYKFRDEAAAAAAGGPAIVATQVVSDYLTPFDGDKSFLAAANQPVTIYTYRMAFARHHDAPQVASAVNLS